MRAIRRILVAIKDPHAKSLPAVDRAAQLGRAFGAELELFHAITQPLSVDAYLSQEGGLEDAAHCIRARCYEALNRLAQELSDSGLEVRANGEWDFPAYEAIVRRARRIKADLIVAECHAGRRLAPWLLHVTDWELLRTSPIPVLLVKSAKPYEQPLVLAAVDPSHVFSKPVKLDEEILRTANQFARALGGPLHTLHAYSPVPATLDLVASAEGLIAVPDLPRHATNVRKAFSRILRGRVPRARQHLVADVAVEAIPLTARKLSASLVVMGAVSRSGLQRMLIGNTAERVLPELPCDVLVVKPKRFVTRVARRPRGARLIVAPDVRA